MSLVQEILYVFSNYPGGYRIIYDILYNGKSPNQSDESFERSIRNTLSRMKRNGLLKNSQRKWTITPEGRELLDGKNSDIKRFFSTRKVKVKRTAKSLILVFDIPEKKRRYRDWLRSELVGFDFEQIQKSVWFGPQLTKEFIEYLEEIDLLKYIRFLKATDEDLI